MNFPIFVPLLSKDLGRPMQTPTAPSLANGLTAEKLAFAARILKLISNPAKLALIQHLHFNGETSVLDLCEALGLSQPLASHHLANLKSGGIVDARRDGKQVFYRIILQEVINVLECMARCELPVRHQ